MDELGCLLGAEPVGQPVQGAQDEGMKAPAIMQAMPSSCLLMLTVISFPPGLRLIAFETILPQGVPARLWRRGLWRWEWNWRDTGFFLRADGGFPP